MKKNVMISSLAIGILSLGMKYSYAIDPGGVSLSGTRLLFDGSIDTASITVKNSSDNDVWLMRFWVSPYDEESNQKIEGKIKSDLFTVTPPLYRLDPNNEVQLRVNRMSDNLPADRESVFYLNNLAIPPKKGEKSYQKDLQTGMQFAVNNRIKLFYRPKEISDANARKDAPNSLKLSAFGNSIMVSNPTPYFITLSRILINGKSVSTNRDTMVSPFGSLKFDSTVPHGIFSYSTIDDRGMNTLKIEKKF